ncbi:prepilin-type N-terminal cleavage/methylation domain-containing protein [Serratia sp. FGI94]|uniref:prepilin-type N-terminal cleavage/methylation domain-containing protein n=1 Tax=Serratia sp. FGI94 TaxID=671990 RepID=UPI0008FFB5C3|nr:prepilin-type N-terminal cleavage/methylation domain-containing protein [Serratia sp. FGI94]
MLAKSNYRSAGFTLLELMMVLVLLGIASSLVIGRFFSADASISHTAIYLKDSLKYMQEQAIQQETLFGLVVTKTGWQPVKYCGDSATGNHKWCKAGSFFSLPGSALFALDVERQTITLPEQIVTGQTPQLWFLPDGEATLFRLCIARRNCGQCLNGGGFMSFDSGEEICEKE